MKGFDRLLCLEMFSKQPIRCETNFSFIYVLPIIITGVSQKNILIQLFNWIGMVNPLLVVSETLLINLV